MPLLSRLTGRSTRTLSTALVAAVAATLTACSADSVSKPASPVLPENPALTPSIRQAAFIFDVNRTTGRVKITAPNGGAISARIDGKGGIVFGEAGQTSNSIVAGDVVDLTTSGFAATGVGTGGCAAGKVCVSFDVSITNRLTGVELIAPTWPTPPAGTVGPLLFPFSAVTTVTSGGSSTGGDGTEIIIETPSVGSVAPNADWDNTAWNFFNDTDCNAVAPVGAPTDCYRSEPYAVVPAGATTVGRRVGFTIDPTVSKFRVRALVVADLRSATLALGSVGGTVSSTALGGGVGGVTVSVGGRTKVTNALGAYLIDSVNVGVRTVSVTAGLPAGCSATPVTVTVNNGATATADFPLAGCTVPAGTVTGSLLSSLGGGLSGIGVIITPDGGVAQPAAATIASGAFSRSGVPVLSGSTGRITGFTGVPASCTAPATGVGLFTYSGLVNGGLAAIAPITFTCVVPPTRYAYTGQWIAGTADTVIYEARINMGADQLSGITVDVQYDNARLRSVPGGVGSSSINADLDSRAYNPALTPNKVRIALFSLAALTTTGNVGLFRIKFQQIAAGSVSQITTISQASGPAPVLANLVPRIDVTDIPLP